MDTQDGEAVTEEFIEGLDQKTRARAYAALDYFDKLQPDSDIAKLKRTSPSADMLF